MTSDHLEPAELRAFADGLADEREAIAWALHVDDCPACAAAVAALDPITEALRATSDPDVPADLAAGVFAAAERPLVQRPEPVVAAVLIALAAVVMGVGGAPTDLLVGAAVTLSALATAFSALPSLPTGPATLWVAAAGVALAVCVVAARHLELRRSR